MEKLVSSGEAAQILGISLQGVHYRIKQGQLKSEKKDGKVFVYVNEKKETKKSDTNLDDILVVKDEQILFLKKSLKWMKKQYQSEIDRLEKNQDKMMEVFQSEISLLQSAFNEMKNIYQVEHKEKKDEKIEFSMMDIKDFFIFMKQNNKSDTEIKSIILERVRQGDKRFIFNKETKEVIIYKSDFMDLI